MRSAGRFGSRVFVNCLQLLICNLCAHLTQGCPACMYKGSKLPVAMHKSHYYSKVLHPHPFLKLQYCSFNFLEVTSAAMSLYRIIDIFTFNSLLCCHNSLHSPTLWIVRVTYAASHALQPAPINAATRSPLIMTLHWPRWCFIFPTCSYIAQALVHVVTKPSVTCIGGL